MRTRYAMAAPSGNVCTAHPVGASAPSGVAISAVIQRARALWPEKTAAELAARTRMSVRTIERYVRGERAMPADALARLLHDEQGFEILVAAMVDAQPRWWRLVLAFMDVADAQKMQATARRKIKRALTGAINAFDETDHMLARADAALAFSDEDFHRPSLDGLRAMARPAGRPMAETPGTKARKPKPV